MHIEPQQQLNRIQLRDETGFLRLSFMPTGERRILAKGSPQFSKYMRIRLYSDTEAIPRRA